MQYNQQQQQQQIPASPRYSEGNNNHHQSYGSSYVPHHQHSNIAHKSNSEYGAVAVQPGQFQSLMGEFQENNSNSTTSRMAPLMNPTNANYSNVQILCRINAPNKAMQGTSKTSMSGAKRPNSASRITFQAGSGPAFKGKEGNNKSIKEQLRIHAHSSLLSIKSTPAIRSSSLDYQKQCKRLEGAFVPLRNKVRPINGVRFPHTSNSSPFGECSRRANQPTNGIKNSQSAISMQSSQHYGGSKQRNSRSPGASFLSAQQSGQHSFLRDSKHSVFTTAQERSNKVIISETPISSKLINEQLAETAQINAFLSTCASNGYDANVFEFDNVFSETQRQDKFYGQSVKPLVQNFVEGENGTVIFFGPSQSGKTYSMHGKVGKERGVVPRAIEDILSIVKNTYEIGADNLNESSLIEDYGTDTTPILSVNGGNHKFGIPKTIMQQNVNPIQVYGNQNAAQDYDVIQDRMFLKISVYMIYCDRVYDLLSTKSGKKVKKEHYIDPQSQQVVSKFVNMTERVVINLEQYYSLIHDAFKERKTISVKLTDHEIRKRSHLVISLSLVSAQHGSEHILREISRLNFTELCGSEQSVTSGGQVRDTSVRQFVTKSFNCLSTQILKSALGKRTQLEEGDSGLVGSLKNTLTSKSNILMVACTSPAPQFFDHSLPAVKFCARIRDTIVRKLQKQGFLKNSSRNTQQLEEANQHAINGGNSQTPVMVKQTRFNLEAEKQDSAARLSTFGRVQQLSDRGCPDSATRQPYSSSLKKGSQRKHSRSSSPMMSIEEIFAVSRKLQDQVSMYDALTREYSHGNQSVLDLNEVKQWAIHNLEVINKALYCLQKWHTTEDFPDKKSRDDTVNLMFYLKERVTAIEKIVMTAIPFRNAQSPKVATAEEVTKFGHSLGTTSAASLHHQEGRENLFNQIVTVNQGSASHREFNTHSGVDDASGLSSAAHRTPHTNEPQFFSNVKRSQRKENYRTFDHKDRSSEQQEGRNSDQNIVSKQPFQSQYGRELSERMEFELRIEKTACKPPQSAREGYRENQSLRNFSHSRSRSPDRRVESHRSSPDDRRNTGENSSQHKVLTARTLESPTFLSGQNILKKQSVIQEIQQNDNDLPSSQRKTGGDFNLVSARDQPDLQLIQDKFLTSQRVQHIIRSTFGNDSQGPAQALYNSAEETLTDIQRLIMLEDFDGLRRRVVQLFKERQSCDQLISTKEVELEELREQLNARDDTVKQIERLNERNIDEYMRTINETQMHQEKQETQTSLHIRNLQETIDAQTNQLEEIKQVRGSEEEKLEQMNMQFELNNRLRQEAETKAQRLQEENQKLYTNYDVLKEHELNIIKDFQDRKVADQTRLDQQIEKLRHQIEEKNDEINNARKNITDLEGELRKQEFETQRVHEQKTLQNDAQGIVQSKLDREHVENRELRDKISRLEKDLDKEKHAVMKEASEKKLAYQEIKQLQELIGEMEKSMQRLSEELRQKTALTEDRMSQISELDTQKRVYEERLQLKEKEMQSYKESKAEMSDQLNKLQENFDELDHKHIKLRASEFDKVDVLKVNAELEGRSKNLQIDMENLIRERNSLQDANKDLEEQNKQTSEAARQLKTELEYYKRTHEMSMDKFDQKFTEFSTELTELTESNQNMKDREKKYKRTIQKLEVRNLELEEKFKYAKIRNNDLNSQVQFVERDMQKLAKDSGEQVQMQIRNVEQNQKRVDATDRAFTDIKSMISQFRQERNGSKEKVEKAGAGRYSRDGSPIDEEESMRLSNRQSSTSPDGWKRQRMSPLRQNNSLRKNQQGRE